MGNIAHIGSRASALQMPAWLVGFVCAVAAALSIGCAASTQTQGTDPGASAQKRPDLVTASDEAPERRRARIRLELAAGYFEAGKTTVALDEIKQSLLADPTFADAYNLRGLLYMRLNDFALADDSFRRSLAINPRDPNTMHNRGWLLCQQQKYAEANALFVSAEAQAGYTDQAKTLMTQGICDVRAGRKAEAETALTRSYELDPGNPLTGYTLANLLFERGEGKRGQFYIRRVNNGDFATAESLWLGMKIDRQLGDNTAVSQLGEQLRKRFPQSPERALFDRGAFDE